MEFDAWTVNSMQTTKYHAANLETRTGPHYTLPERHTRHGTTPYITNNTVSIIDRTGMHHF